MSRTAAACCLAALVAIVLAWGAQRPDGGRAMAAAVPATARTDAAPAVPRVLLRIFRGWRQPAPQEVSTTTLLGPGVPTIVADPDIAEAGDEELEAQLRSIFSVPQVVALGSTITQLEGGRALLDDDEGRPLDIRISGQPAPGRTARIVLSMRRAGKEEIATSLLLRVGRTVIVAGPQDTSAQGERFTFIAVTVLQPAAHS